MSSASTLAVSADSRAIEEAAAWLERAERPVCVAGRGASWAGASAALLALCAKLPRLRIASTPGAKGVFPERHPQSLGVWGFSGHPTAERGVACSDVLLVVGTRLHEQSTNDWHPRLKRGRTIRIDRDPVRVPPRPDSELGLLGDARVVLERLAEALSCPVVAPGEVAPGEPGHFRFEQPGDVDRLLRPEALLGVIGRLAQGVPVCADAGNAMCWAIEWLERNSPNEFHVSLDWGTMGFAVPAAIGVCLSRGGAPVIALTGDGSMAMAGGELHTAVELEIPLVVVVLNDSGSGMIRAGSRAWFGPNAVPDPSYRHRMSFIHFARAMGADARLVTSCQDFATDLERALAAATPTVFDVMVDPEAIPAAVGQRVRGLATRPDASLKQGGGMC